MRSRLVRLLLLAAWALLAPASAVAQEEDAEETDEPDTPESGRPGEGGSELERPPTESGAEDRRIAVLVLAASGVDPETADALTELAIGVIAARGGVSIVGKEEFQARLGQGEARSIECVSSTACLGRVGVELGVDELIAGTVGRRGSLWVFNVNRIAIRTGELAGRVFREVDGDVGALADALSRAVPELYRPVLRSAVLLVSANVDDAEVAVDGMLVGVFQGEAVRIDDLAPGRHEVVVSRAGYYDWSRVLNVAEGATMQIEASLDAPRIARGGASLHPLVWVGLVTALAGGGAAVGFGLVSQDEPEGMMTRAEAISFVDARQTEATFANIGMGVAAAGVVTAIIGLVVSDWGGREPAEGEADVAAVITPEGGSVRVGGRF
jgi:hypothetical protein